MAQVSVIIPNYNYGHLLRRRIESVLTQGYSDMEVFLLDDASTDDSLSIMQEYAARDGRVRVVEREKNSGSPYVQWLRGLAMATGKYIWIAEADDYAEPTLLERCVRVLDEKKDVVLAMVSSHIVDEAGQELGRDYDHWRRRGIAEGSVEQYASNVYLKCMYERNMLYNASGVVFRKEAVTEHSKTILQSMRYSADWFFWSDMVKQGSVVEIHERLNYFCQHAGSVTRQGGLVAIEENKSCLHEIEKMVHIPCWKRIFRYRKLKKTGR